MLIAYIGPSHDGLTIERADVLVIAKRKVPVEVPDDIGAELVARGDFEAVKPKEAKP